MTQPSGAPRTTRLRTATAATNTWRPTTRSDARRLPSASATDRSPAARSRSTSTRALPIASAAPATPATGTRRRNRSGKEPVAPSHPYTGRIGMPTANGTHEAAVPLANRSYASPMPRTTSASPTMTGDTAARSTPTAAVATATTRASSVRTTLPGMGLPGLRPASARASTRSLTVPMANWSDAMDTPSRKASALVPPATMTTTATTTPSRIDGKGWTSRAKPDSRARTVACASLRAGRVGRPSDVDELVEVGDEVLDQALAAVGDLGADAGHECPERDRRDHQPPLGVPPDARGGPAPGREHALEPAVIEPRGLLEVRHDLHHASPDRDVPHQFGGPRIDLVVGLLVELGPVLGRVGGQAGRDHRSSMAARMGRREYARARSGGGR